ncbi:hypothetical protein C7377_1868 [Balneicella halophila]|uniref:Gliding motility-associated protein GldM C-terminal domain-containing protein n=1 Tax=Balneicella halophila TaxID=1537566 RepID=A0A7L4UN13_BALHA|nr:hypothetical protein [Balneicella halophila]PVX49224.1 hypothetical protein C7377_1868 [Balneicella halophila]
MRKTLILVILCALFSIGLNAQENISCYDTIINLQEVSVYAKQGLSTIKSNNKKGSIHVRGKGKTSLVTKIDVDKNTSYNLDGIEFFFNYQWQGFDGEGFYIKPLILTSKNGKPDSDYLNNQILYFVSKEINEVIHIDLSELDIKINGISSFFIGIEFVDADGQSNFEDFNVTMVPIKKELNTSFIKGSCPKCTFSPFDLDEKNGLSLKYILYYKE